MRFRCRSRFRFPRQYRRAYSFGEWRCREWWEARGFEQVWGDGPLVPYAVREAWYPRIKRRRWCANAYERWFGQPAPAVEAFYVPSWLARAHDGRLSPWWTISEDLVHELDWKFRLEMPFVRDRIVVWAWGAFWRGELGDDPLAAVRLKYMEAYAELQEADEVAKALVGMGLDELPRGSNEEIPF